jgi:hypothetical protein
MESPDTHHKALAINLDAAFFGSFAEIGASATVAKTICAYDKEVSDEIYGAGSRYVSSERLRAMLDKEWEQLLSQLGGKRGAKTRFFAFCDTVVARNYAGTNLPHGWMGLRFQEHPEAPRNDVIVHFNLLDPTTVQEQEAIGVLGVNLMYAVLFERANAETFLKGLASGVAPQHVEIDHIEVRGPVFENDASGGWDDGLMHALLVTHRFAEAVMCGQDGTFEPFIDALHKKSVLLAPGIFERPSLYHADMMATGLRKLQQEQGGSEDSQLGLFCLTVPPLLPQENPVLTEMLGRMAELQRLGYCVLLVHEREIYKMSAIVQRFTSLPIRFVVGISIMLRVFEDDYRHLGGNTLKAVSLLFSQDVRIYAYPMPTRVVRAWINKLSATGWEWSDVDGTVYADSLRPPGPLRHLYQYLLASHFVVPIEAGDLARPLSPGDEVQSVTGN